MYSELKSISRTVLHKLLRLLSMEISYLDYVICQTWTTKAFTPRLFKTPIGTMETAAWRPAKQVADRSPCVNAVTMTYNSEHYKRKRPASTAPAGSGPKVGALHDLGSAAVVPKAEVIRAFDPSRFNFRKASVKEHMLYIGRDR